MPILKKTPVEIDFEVNLSANSKAQWLVFVNALGCDLSMWEEQVPIVLPQFNILRVNSRGIGKSSFSESFTINNLAEDIVFLLDELKISQTNFIGISMGGLVGLSLANFFPQRLQKLIISNSGAKLGTGTSWSERIELINAQGVSAIISPTINRWFTADFQKRAPQKVEPFINMLATCSVEGYLANCRAISQADFRADLSKIQTPTLIICGEVDTSTPKELSHEMAKHIPHNNLVTIPCAHIANVECSEMYNRTLLEFLT